MVEPTKKIWMNGKLVDWKDANVHILTHTLHYGSGAFEGIRAYNTEKGTAVFRLKEHVDRLYASAEALFLKIPYTKQEIIKAIKDTVKINGLKECYIRPIVYYGYGPMGVDTTNSPTECAIICWAWGAYLGEEGIKRGITTLISKQTRKPGPLNKAKVTGHYYESSLAKREALSKGAHEAIMLDSLGKVAEGSGENIFVVKDGKIRTPKEGSILLGITRNSVMQIAKEIGIKIEEAELTKEDLYSADEVFFTGTAAEVTPVRKIDDKDVSDGIGPFTKRIQQHFFDMVKKADKHPEWFDFVK